MSYLMSLMLLIMGIVTAFISKDAVTMPLFFIAAGLFRIAWNQEVRRR